jgi:hypothetical protein
LTDVLGVPPPEVAGAPPTAPRLLARDSLNSSPKTNRGAIRAGPKRTPQETPAEAFKMLMPRRNNAQARCDRVWRPILQESVENFYHGGGRDGGDPIARAQPPQIGRTRCSLVNQGEQTLDGAIAGFPSERCVPDNLGAGRVFRPRIQDFFGPALLARTRRAPARQIAAQESGIGRTDGCLAQELKPPVLCIDFAQAARKEVKVVASPEKSQGSNRIHSVETSASSANCSAFVDGCLPFSRRPNSQNCRDRDIASSHRSASFHNTGLPRIRGAFSAQMTSVLV